jgi:hypothetical protein
VRWSVYWPEVQPYRTWAEVPAGQVGQFVDAGGIPTDLRRTDSVVEGAARCGHVGDARVDAFRSLGRRERVHPLLASAGLGGVRRLAVMLAARYGTQGSFWTTHPDVPRRPSANGRSGTSLPGLTASAR